MASTARATESWYAHPVYARYWQHYYQAMVWMRSHQNAYWKAVGSYCGIPWYFSRAFHSQSSYANEAGYPQSSSNHHRAWQDSQRSYSQVRRSGRPPYERSRARKPRRKEQTWFKDEEVEAESEDEVEYDLSNMEITDELRQYFAETERHREERRRQQQLDAERLDDYVNADHGLYCDTRRSVLPPTERPGERRQAEMKRLYGDSAAKIQAMEAAVQLSFDKHCDRKQPKYWPVIPLKF